MKHAPKAIVMIALALSLGLHWVVLQSVAWAGMFADYSAKHSFAVAIDKTFDAGNKCQLCRFVEAGTTADAESETDYTVKLTKIDGFNARGEEMNFVPAVLEFSLLDIALPVGRSDSPPSPPPPWA